MYKKKPLLSICNKIENGRLNEDATIKYLIKTRDNNFFEAVLIFEDTLTLCISSQIGCNVKCKFCVTGKDAFKRNLSEDEILEQVEIIEKDYGKEIECISFMGMGEPTLNLENVIKSMKRFYTMNKKIKISTVGIPGTIRKLADVDIPFDLYFSLHTANSDKRREIIPISKNYELNDIVEELNYLARKKGNIIVWYLMLNGINDGENDLSELVEFLGKMETIKLVYIKDYCESGNGFHKAGFEKMNNLVTMLNGMGISSKMSVSEGQDIDAGCGQLRQRVMNKFINL